MSTATLIYPHQLFAEHPALKKPSVVYLVEEPLFLTEFPIHRQKLLLHRLTLMAYRERLSAAGHRVHYLSVTDYPTSADIFSAIARDGVTDLHIVDTTDDWLERRISEAATLHHFTLHRYESPLFLLARTEAITRYEKSKRHLARFYEALRRDRHILMQADGEPLGGQFSFDAENRRRFPATATPPDDPEPCSNTDVAAALEWLNDVPGEHYGEALVWLPYTHEAAEEWLTAFLKERFADFGPYEDAIVTDRTRLFHSVLSPLLNIGLLTPKQVLEKTLAYADKHETPLPSLEGFVRQILGWREFVRAAYETDGRTLRTSNFWQHQRSLPESFWTGTTGILPLDDTIKKALHLGYTHHIERLMVMGNFMLLSEIHPNEAYRWFMAMYVDAYDWVMVPNIYAMSQFSSEDTFATKPYISGSNYLRKMSNYPAGDWEKLWTALYWHFIEKHERFFSQNHRLAMMPRLLAKLAPETRAAQTRLVQDYLGKG